MSELTRILDAIGQGDPPVVRLQGNVLFVSANGTWDTFAPRPIVERPTRFRSQLEKPDWHSRPFQVIAAVNPIDHEFRAPIRGKPI